MSDPSNSLPSHTPPESDSTTDEAPPVRTEPPKSSRLLHLFLIPLAAVTALVAVAVLFGYLGHVGQSPRDHVEQLRHPTRVAWQSAATLSQMLQDPGRAELRRDAELASDLAGILEEHLNTAPADERHVNLRVFLCRALGEFEVAEGLPVLLEAASNARDPAELPVRLAALEAIAVRIDRQGADVAGRYPQLLATLLAAASLPDAPINSHDHELIRERAAYALGVLGNPAALAQLDTMLADPYPNVRFNAALGLARHGDQAAVPLLVIMLDPQEPSLVEGESGDRDAQMRKRTTVLINALRASRQLAERNPQLDLSRLVDAVEELVSADVEPAVRLEAKSVLNSMRKL
jgi:HEAT repeat protein